MQPATTRQLTELNRRFYADFGTHFSATRQRIQPGVRKIASHLVGTERILDLGCGNGEFARSLAKNGFHGMYTGLDFSLPLLTDARSQPDGFSARFYEADLTEPGWERVLEAARFSLITAFAVLHHIPAVDKRLDILQKVRQLLEPTGKFILSSWQFLNSEKLRNRIQPWEAAGISIEDVDDGDYLLDWRGGGSGLRYVHHFSPQELDHLAAASGFTLAQSFLSDGESDRLGLYQVWECHENKG